MLQAGGWQEESTRAEEGAPPRPALLRRKCLDPLHILFGAARPGGSSAAAADSSLARSQATKQYRDVSVYSVLRTFFLFADVSAHLASLYQPHAVELWLQRAKRPSPGPPRARQQTD